MAIGDKYEEAILKGKLVYTVNGGWIDTNHANPKTSRGNLGVGAGSLWNQLVLETGKKSSLHGVKGFKVTYRQDAVVDIKVTKVYGGVTKEYFVQQGLSSATKESVALAIFREVSLAFEAKQAYAFWSSSSFSIEDLVSNLIGFYSVVRPGIDYLKLCQPLTTEQSLEIYRSNQGTFEKKNKSFKPVYFGYRQCGSGGKLPGALQKIVPASKGKLFRDWSMLDDLSDVFPPRKLKLLGRW